MSLKLQEQEKVLFEGAADKSIFSMWIFTKVIPMGLFYSFITMYLFLIVWLLAVVLPSGEKNLHFPIAFFSKALYCVPAWIVILFFYYDRLRVTLRYTITNQRCVFEGGIMIKRSRNVPFHKITDVEINQNIIERLLRLYSLKIFTPGTGSAGMPGFEKAEIIFFGLKDAETPAGIIQQIMTKFKATGE